MESLEDRIRPQVQSSAPSGQGEPHDPRRDLIVHLLPGEDVPHETVVRFSGRTNDRPFGGAAAGHLLFRGCGYDPDRGAKQLRFTYRRWLPFNGFLLPSGQVVVVRDAAGRLPFQGIDFRELLKAGFSQIGKSQALNVPTSDHTPSTTRLTR